MRTLTIRHAGKAQIRIAGIPPVVVACLHEIKDILSQRDQAGPHERLFPSPTQDSESIRRDWAQFVTPDLKHLFESAGETLAADLEGMEPEKGATGFCRVIFPSSHLDAWMSAINQARLILGELAHVTEADMNLRRPEPGSPRHAAVVRIAALGWLLEHLVAFQMGKSVT